MPNGVWLCGSPSCNTLMGCGKVPVISMKGLCLAYSLAWLWFVQCTNNNAAATTVVIQLDISTKTIYHSLNGSSDLNLYHHFFANFPFGPFLAKVQLQRDCFCCVVLGHIVFLSTFIKTFFVRKAQESDNCLTKYYSMRCF